MNSSRNTDIFDPKDFFIGPSSIDSGSEGPTPISSASRVTDQTSINGHIENPIRHSTDLSGYVAIGSLRVQQELQGPFGGKYLGTHDHQLIQPLIDKGWIITKFISHVSIPGLASLRVFVLPEDTDRQTRRVSMTDLRRALKSLLNDLDISEDSWNATYNPKVPIKTYFESLSENESLFYIFNTLPSPSMPSKSLNDVKSDRAVLDVLNDTIPGLITELYPYQKRSIATMIQREVSPTRSLDPRNLAYTDLCSKKFFLDTFEGVVLKQSHLYEEPRGGILAETMGYGKTLICLAVILATRGHYPDVPDDCLEILPEARSGVGSLFNMAAAAVTNHGAPWKLHFHALREEGYYHERCVEKLSQSFRKYNEPIFHPTNPGRTGKRSSTKVVQICSTTLVIVPPNLLVQWQSQILSHTKSGSLDLLVIDNTVKVPNWRELAKYDVVLITKSRFEHEYRDNDLHTGKRDRGEERFQSPLTDVRWLRVICDEGHGFASSATRTNAMAMLDKLYVERRWVVSGTPSHNMLGVEVGLAAKETGPDFEIDTAETLNNRKNAESVAQEIKDVDRLRLMVINFLKVKPWANRYKDIASFRKYIAVSDGEGPNPRSASLRCLLQGLIVRHQIEDIKIDLALPPLYNKVKYLEPSFYDTVSLNIFVLVLVSNAVTSERTDEDYMFHPKNRKQLEILIGNLRQSSFHWVGFQHNDIEEALKAASMYLNKNLDAISDADGTMLTEAIMVGEHALADPGWNAFSKLHEIGTYIENFPEQAAEAWAMHGSASIPLLLGTVQARQSQQYILEHLSDLDPGEGLTGAGLRAMQAARARAIEENQATNKNQSQPRVVSEEPKLKQQTSPTRARASSFSSKPNRRRISHPVPTLAPESYLLQAQIVGFSSAKLTYLMDEVLRHSREEKIIIFYDANNVAFWIAEALELLQISFRIYANTLNVTKRAEYLAAFNANSDIRVLLMDLKQAAHGLHVAAASRVYIVSPIWQPSVESQAIKRAHRIGQKRPVYVETLVLKDTLEDRMLKRRKQMSNTELLNAQKSLLDDGTMGQIIKDERFIKLRPGQDSEGGKVARLRTPVNLFGSGRSEVNGKGLESIDGSGIVGEHSGEGYSSERLPKRRKITFGLESRDCVES